MTEQKENNGECEEYEDARQIDIDQKDNKKYLLIDKIKQKLLDSI